MRFEKSIDINASPQRVWEVLTGFEAWPQRIGTVDTVKVLTAPPIDTGTQVQLKQQRLPDGIWDINVWNVPLYFEWTQKQGGVTSVAGHRVEALGERGARLTLTFDMSGLLVPLIGLFYKKLTTEYLDREAEDIRRAAESA